MRVSPEGERQQYSVSVWNSMSRKQEKGENVDCVVGWCGSVLVQTTGTEKLKWEYSHEYLRVCIIPLPPSDWSNSDTNGIPSHAVDVRA